MKSITDPRHAKRREIMKRLFAWEARQKIKSPASPASTRGEPAGGQISNIKKATQDDLISEVISNLSLIDNTIEGQAKKWPKEKINAVDLAILRLAVYELTVAKKVPVKVAVDEAIELAKEFGSESSPGFINGVLGSVLSQTKNE